MTADQDEGSSAQYSIGAELDHPDPEGETVTIVSIDSVPSHGSASLVSATTIDYEHDGSETTEDEITYTITDTAGNQASGRLLLTILPVNDPPTLNSGHLDVVASVPIDVAIGVSDPDGSVFGANVSGLPSSLSNNFSSAAQEIRISGTAPASLRGTAVTINITVFDTQGGSTTAPFDLIFDPIALSPNVGRVKFSEVLFRESEKWDPSDPNNHAFLMDEYIEWTMVENITMTGYRVTDYNPYIGVTDLDRYPAGPTSSLDAGNIDETWGSSSFSAGTIITTAIRWVANSSFLDYDGVYKSTIPFDSWWYQTYSTYYGFFPPDNSKWQAFNDHGDELWLFDPNGLLVDFIAWDDGTGQGHVHRPPEALGIWNDSAEQNLATVNPGQSISLAASLASGTFSSECWEPTATGSATCPGAIVTRDRDTGTASRPASLERVSSQGLAN